MHGAHRSRNTLVGEAHPQFKHGRSTKRAKEQHQKIAAKLHFLEDLGHHIKMFHKDAARTRGRKPNGYLKLNLNDTNQLALAILKTIKNSE
jgi:hypothetical protein